MTLTQGRASPGGRAEVGDPETDRGAEEVGRTDGRRRRRRRRGRERTDARFGQITITIKD